LVLGFRPDWQAAAEKRLFEFGISKADLLKDWNRLTVSRCSLSGSCRRYQESGPGGMGLIDLDEL